MSFSVKELLSSVSRDRCVANLKDQEAVKDDAKYTVFSSVLIPLCVINDEVHILYTVRSMKLKNHSGQICFPGGKKEGDESVFETALRETEEEIGVPRENVDVWGQMSPVEGRNKHMLITPIVGEIKNFDMKKLVASADEVDEIFTVPISVLCDPDHQGYLAVKPILPVFVYDKHKIWGITALLTHQFLEKFLTKDDYKHNFLRKIFDIEELMPVKV